MGDEFLQIGKVLKPHGIRGRIKMEYFGDDLDRFDSYQEVFIPNGLGRPRRYGVLNVVSSPPRLILQLEGVTRIEDVEPLAGKPVMVKRADLPPLEAGEYYCAELLGMTVETDEGREIGYVKDIFATGAHDVLVVEGKRRDILLPVTDLVVTHIDRQKRVMRVHRLEGLWEASDEV